jgi:hypothetical protein
MHTCVDWKKKTCSLSLLVHLLLLCRRSIRFSLCINCCVYMLAKSEINVGHLKLCILPWFCVVYWYHTTIIIIILIIVILLIYILEIGVNISKRHYSLNGTNFNMLHNVLLACSFSLQFISFPHFTCFVRKTHYNYFVVQWIENWF